MINKRPGLRLVRGDMSTAIARTIEGTVRRIIRNYERRLRKADIRGVISFGVYFDKRSALGEISTTEIANCVLYRECQIRDREVSSSHNTLFYPVCGNVYAGIPDGFQYLRIELRAAVFDIMHNDDCSQVINGMIVHKLLDDIEDHELRPEAIKSTIKQAIRTCRRVSFTIWDIEELVLTYFDEDKVNDISRQILHEMVVDGEMGVISNHVSLHNTYVRKDHLNAWLNLL